HRISGLAGIFHNLWNDGYQRYLNYYWTALSGVNKFKVAGLVFATGGAIAMFADRKLRVLPFAKRLLILAAIGCVGVAFVDNEKYPLYFVYSMPALAACAAVWVYYQWQKGGFGRLAACGLLAASILATVGGFGYKIYRNEYA